MLLRPLMRYAFWIFISLVSFVSAMGQVNDFGEVDFHRADSVANRYNGYSLENLVELSHKLTKPFSADVEKFRAIYTWVCENIAGDPQLFEQNQ